MVAGSNELPLQDFLEEVWPDSGNDARVVDAVFTRVTHLCEEDTVPWPLREEDATDDVLPPLLPGREADLLYGWAKCLGDFRNMVFIHLWNMYGLLCGRASDSLRASAGGVGVAGGGGVVVVGGLRDSAVTNDALAVSGLEG